MNLQSLPFTCGVLIAAFTSVHALSTDLSFPELEPFVLEPVGQFGPGAERENSGLVKSRHYDNLYWTINDSGDEPRVYPIRSDGTVYGASRYADEPGVLVGGAINVDWEDIAADDQGNLIICDVGNNGNNRRDLVFYILPEPAPQAGRTTWIRRIFFRYPEQKTFPAARHDFNYDCEGVFYAHGKIYLVTKNRSDTWTNLYCLPEMREGVVNDLQLVSRFDIGGKTTAADLSPDGRRLAITTYNAIWVFETEGYRDDFFAGRIFWYPFQAPQVEAICWEDGDTLLLGDESAKSLYRVKFSELVRVDSREWRGID